MPVLMTKMHHADHDPLHMILLRLGAPSPDQIELRAIERTDVPIYRAVYGNKWAYVDRNIAIRLRENGAVWSGEVLRDPCAVA